MARCYGPHDLIQEFLIFGKSNISSLSLLPLTSKPIALVIQHGYLGYLLSFLSKLFTRPPRSSS